MLFEKKVVQYIQRKKIDLRNWRVYRIDSVNYFVNLNRFMIIINIYDCMRMTDNSNLTLNAVELYFH